MLLPIIFSGAFVATVFLSRAAAGATQSLTFLVCSFVPALVPIALAYHLAHNLAFLLLGLQYLVPILSDPFGAGWDLFGTKLYIVDISVVNAQMLWFVAIGAIVIGHVIAVILAHVIALRLFTGRLSALRSQAPMIVLMVAYTMTSLWTLAQPITNARAGG